MDNSPITPAPATVLLKTPTEGHTALVIRRALVVIVVAVCCYVAYGFGRLWAEWHEASEPKAHASSAATEFDSLAAMLPLTGPWSFTDVDWNFKSDIVEETEVCTRLEALAASTGGDMVELRPDVSKKLIELAHNLHIQPIVRGENEVYFLEVPDLKAEMVVRNVNGNVKVVGVAAASARGDRWQFLEFAPQAGAKASGTAELHLLPLPGSAKRMGGRFSDDGHLLLELLAVDSNADDLVSAWKKSGWEVRPSGLGDPSAFSYLCARGQEVIYAWSANDRSSLQNLMLVRSPSPADTMP